MSNGSNEPVLLWEILVPTLHPGGKQIKIPHHRIWDNKVREIAGGITIFHPAKGHWVNPDGELFIERMIPVRIACTRSQIESIADMTAAHYQQEAVMFYALSRDIFIKHYPRSKKK